MALYLVTGGAGFIGSHIVRRLLGEGNRVRVLDNFSTGSRSNVEGLAGKIEIVEGDIGDTKLVRQTAQGADYILHLAAQVSVPASVEDPIGTQDINVGGTRSVLVAARHAGVKRLVLSSSCAVYGETADLPLTESSPTLPISPYAETKLQAERCCRDFFDFFGLPTVALRYFNVFGPGQSPESQYAAVIPKFVSAITSGQVPMIFGDGEQTRDFVYVDNVVQANLLACKSEKAIGQVLNIGSGVKTSLNQLLAILSDIAGKSVTANYAPPRQGDIRHSVGDISLARELLGYECGIELVDGLKKTFEYFSPEASIKGR